MNRIIDSIEENVKAQFLKTSKVNQLTIWMVSVLNQNLLIILVGVTLSFTVEFTLKLAETKLSEDGATFFYYSIITLFWILLSIVQVSHAVKFLVLQNELPIGSVKNRDININASINYILQKRIGEVRHLSFLLALIFLFSSVILLLMIIYFLEINQWINLSGKILSLG